MGMSKKAKRKAKIFLNRWKIGRTVFLVWFILFGVIWLFTSNGFCLFMGATGVLAYFTCCAGVMFTTWYYGLANERNIPKSEARGKDEKYNRILDENDKPVTATYRIVKKTPVLRADGKPIKDDDGNLVYIEEVSYKEVDELPKYQRNSLNDPVE